MLPKIVRGFAWIWIGVAVAVILLGYVRTLFKQGFPGLQQLVSPLNIANFIAIVITLAPGIVLLMLAEAVEQRRRTHRGGSVARAARDYRSGGGIVLSSLQSRW